MIDLRDLHILGKKEQLALLPEGKLLINTINAHSYNTAVKDELFADSLKYCDVVLPDGASIVYTFKMKGWKPRPLERIAGYDLFSFEMEKLNKRGGKCFFLGSSEKVLAKIKKRAAVDYPNIQVETYSPPYKKVFSEEDSKAMIDAVNAAKPDLLWIGMTAPKQEKWTYSHWDKLDINCHCGTIGAVFDFYAGTVKRAPLWYQKHCAEWLYRLVHEPKRMWRRYVFGNPIYIKNVMITKNNMKKTQPYRK
ncbi:N-acetylglucosaminyldiphosphoundecaprenol N-acetyl-beta-D-mannosaminyltransferase [Bacteroidales bacterium KHT7]|jgi:N-acetylglucosaminyldiphosphoundecaprenol N-acetyl-beta-D-mannosaminyltransferase|nr:N-acetylglucosaminyldiphosphoundecaprenol N-acetyl-beta-D-mannosaminyltransferase [Bacteroidales bacterium KHT7]